MTESSSASNKKVKARVAALLFNEEMSAPVLVLQEEDGDRTLPIFIGLLEASAIALHLEDVDLVRPMTHDLLKNTVVGLGGELVRVEVTALLDNTFYALLFVQRGKKLIELDCRPSDGIALALRMDAPIWVHEQVLEVVIGSGEGFPMDWSAEHDPEKLKEYLESLDPDAFGKYKM